MDGVPGRAAEHTYLLSLGFQGLQVVGHSFQLFLKLRAFAGVLHTEHRGEEEEQEEERYIERGGEPEAGWNRGTSGNRKRGKRNKRNKNPKINQNRDGGQGEPEVPLTQQECAMMMNRSLHNCCMQVVRSYTV